ncbi:MAG: (2Fe-2S) ferredoxin domain-containing protein [Chloroherpetonaceae bacterium]|nr:(2Fe-2S) ferredoxin domain-containing protein [Chloroherpetonaceae bacterium]
MRFRSHLFICLNEKHCGKHQSEQVQLYLKRRLKELHLTDLFRANKSGCLDACDFAPSSVSYPEGVWLQLKSDQDAEEYLLYLLGNRDSIEHLTIKLYKNE